MTDSWHVTGDNWKPIDELIDKVISNVTRCYTCDSIKYPIYKYHVKGQESKRYYCLQHAPKFGIIQQPTTTRTIYE